jgi:hypothetical protein
MNRKKEAGQALIAAITALGIVLMGFAGLGIDMGYMRYEKRLQQTAADAAAIAGANNIANGGITAGAKAASTSNGFTDGTNGVTVTVNNGPTTGPHANDTKYVEVLVAAVQPTFFMRALGINNETVTARAVATNLSGVNTDCLYLMGPTPNIDLDVNGGGNGGIQAGGCGILVNGDFTTGNSKQWVLDAGGVSVVASSSSGGKDNVNCSSGQSPCPAFGVPAAGNPLANMTTPPVGTPQAWNNNNPVPGTYNGMSIGNATVNLQPGIYVIDGGSFSCGGNANITGSGVMFYLTNGASWSCAGTPSVTLTPPSASSCPACSSTYYGILIYEDPSDHNVLQMSGTSNLGGYGGLIDVYGIAVNGTDTLTLSGTAGYGTTAVKNTVLVE